jgi:foldase protein PrsA
VRRILVGILALAALVGAGCGKLGPTAATVNGSRVSQKDVDGELEAIRDNEAYRQALEASLSQQGQRVTGEGKGTFDAGFAASILTRRIYVEVVRQEITKRGLEVTDADLGRARQALIRQLGGSEEGRGRRMLDDFPAGYRDDLVRREAEVQVLATSLGKVDESDRAVQDYFDQHKEELGQVCIMHVLVDSQEAAGAVKGELDGGADFGLVAAGRSQDPSAKENRGDLKCESLDAYDPEFAQAVGKLRVGQVSDPVQTQFGWHVIKVYERKPATLDEQAAERIRARLGQQGEEAFTGWLLDALKKAKVDVNPKFGRFSKSEGRPRVVPPQGATPTTPTAAP